MKSALVVAAAVATLLGPALAAPAATAAPAPSDSDSTATLCALTSFDDATIDVDPKSGMLTLVVSGMRPATNVEIELVPLVYIQQPIYWGIQVLGCASGIGLPVLTPYTEKLDVTNTLGTSGIAVIGANGSALLPTPRMVSPA